MNQLFGQPVDSVHAAELDATTPSPGMRPLPVGGAEQAFFHIDVRRSLQLHWRLALNVAIGFVALGIVYFLSQVFLFRTWPTYEAASLVYVQPTPPRVLEQGGAVRWPYDINTYESYILQQMMNVTRDDVMASAVKKLGNWRGPKENEQAAEIRLAQSLSVTREGNSYEFSIGARARTPEWAAAIANAVTAAYMESAVRDEHTGDDQRISMLQDEKDRIQKELTADHTEQDTLNKQLGVASVGQTVPDHYDDDITQTRAELIRARTDHDAAEAKFAALDAGDGPSSAAIDAQADEMIAGDAGLVSMKTALNARRAALITQMANLTPSHPEYKQDEVELAKINDELDSMMKDLRAKAAARIQLQLKADLQRTAGVEADVNGQLRQLVGAAGSATPKLQRSSDLASDINRLQIRYASVDEQLHNLMLENHAPAAAYQVTPAVAPLVRSKSGVLRNTILLVLAGLFFGLLAAVAAHKLDNKVRIANDVELILGFPPMAQLPDFTEVSPGVADEYLLRLATSIEHARQQSHLRSCVFTGTGAGTGTTMLVNRVGEMLEAMGRPTVLVDASALPPSGSRPSAAGLVPADRISRPTALLQQMAEEIEHQEGSLVLTDTAPLLVSAETEYLARFVDCAIVVIESGKTTRAELRQAAATLQRLDVAAVGFVLNRVGLAKADSAFRASVESIEAHLRSQASHAPRRPERAPAFVSDRPLAEEVAPSETHSRDVASRALFEPGLAAAAAAVERFSHPAIPDLAACLPSPTVPVTVAESARRFSLPFVADPFAPSATKASAAPLAESEAAVPPVEPMVPPVSVSSPVPGSPVSTSPVPVSAPFAEAARHFSSPAGAGPALSAPAYATPFADVAEHFASTQPVEPTVPSAVAVPSAPDEFATAVVSSAESESHLPEQVFDTAAVDSAPDLKSDAAEAIEPQPVGEKLPVTETADEASRMPKPTSEPETVAIPAFVQSASAAPQPTAAPTTLPEPAPDSATQVPWWLSQATRQGEPYRPPVLWQPARVWMAQKADQDTEPFETPARQEEPHVRAAAPPTWERISTEPNTPVSPNGSEAAHEPELDEMQTPLTSRLSGLRNLLFVLGVKNSREGDDGSQDPSGYNGAFDRNAFGQGQPDSNHSNQANSERSNFDRANGHDWDRAAALNIGGAAPRLITAPPQFLPPKPAVIPITRDDASASESSTRPDRRATYDGVEILPSRRGQYKKL